MRGAVALAILTACAGPAWSQATIDAPIEPGGWSGGPRPVALRCAGLIDVLLSVQPGNELLAASGLLVLEAEELSAGEEERSTVVRDAKAYAAAYLALPQDEATQAIVASDFESCWTFATVLQGKHR